MGELLLAPFADPSLARGLAAAILVGLICPVVGTFVVLRGMAFLGDALAHAVLPGLAVGYLASGGERGPLFWWGLGTGVLTALGIGAITREGRLKEDTAIGVVFAGMFALGVALISAGPTSAADLIHLLFGNVLAVSAGDLVLTALFGGLVLAAVGAFYKEFLVLAFDPQLARTLRLPTTALHYLLLVLIAVAVVVSLQAVGLALVVALLVTPSATAYLWARRLPAMMAGSALIGVVSSVIGLYLAYYADMASGAAIVLVCTGIFLVAFRVAPQGGRAGAG